MNLLIIIFVFLFVLSLTDFFPLTQKSHKILYETAFFATFFLFGIKYYYGGDIFHYVPLYDGIESPLKVLLQESKFADNWEFGFLLFCSICKFLGLSFWLMTLIITIFYFYVIHKLFEKIPSKKIFALFFLVILDYNLIFAAYRQCLSVSCFILMIYAFTEYKYLKCLIFFILTSLLHKSGFYISVISISFLFFTNIKLDKRIYYILFILLLFMLILPFMEYFTEFIKKFNLSESAYQSIKHHLLLGKKFQTIIGIYLLLIIIVAYHHKINFENKKIEWFIFASILMLIVLYQQYYILNRIRSYFIPILIVYVFNLSYDKIRMPNTLILRQIFVILIYIYSLNSIRAKYIDFNITLVKSGIYNSSTIFDRIKKSEAEIKKEQMRKAKIYWEEEFMENDTNYIKK